MAITKNGQILRVLLVEDSEEDERLLARQLRKTGYRVIVKRVQTEASMQLALEGELWDVIVCDYKLPSFSAERALGVAKRIAPKIPFIVVSGVINEEIAKPLLENGAHDFVGKEYLFRLPFAIRRDLRALAEHMEIRLELERSYEATISAWGKALELRDLYTAGHTQRVTDLTMRLARALGVPREELEHIHRGALLHDVGKMGIPDSILLKPDKLTENERAAMSLHPELAYNLLKSIPFLEPALDIPYCHHEHWNGSGYPNGLEGERIPLAARIFAVVDTYDALTSNRPYRSPIKKEAALRYIVSERDEAFDPRIVDAFVELLEGD